MTEMPWPIRLLGLGPSCPFVTFAFKARLSPLITSTSTRQGAPFVRDVGGGGEGGNCARCEIPPMIRTEAITLTTPRHNRRVPLAISLWLNPVFRPYGMRIIMERLVFMARVSA